MNRTSRYIAVILELSALLTAGISLAQQSQSEDTEKALRAQADRARVIYERGRAAHYTQKFDLSGMPHYVPKQQLTGWIRLHGNNYLSDGMLGELWQHRAHALEAAPGAREELVPRAEARELAIDVDLVGP